MKLFSLSQSVLSRSISVLIFLEQLQFDINKLVDVVPKNSTDLSVTSTEERATFTKHRIATARRRCSSSSFFSIFVPRRPAAGVDGVADHDAVLVLDLVLESDNASSLASATQKNDANRSTECKAVDEQNAVAVRRCNKNYIYKLGMKMINTTTSNAVLATRRIFVSTAF
ncbi:unnamed protein product [Amoebophrya sp. A120]|nr:unnamed protein product [Amoebophrya sp. A120]|eukprot:GSA120T00016088001.1